MSSFVRPLRWVFVARASIVRSLVLFAFFWRGGGLLCLGDKSFFHLYTDFVGCGKCKLSAVIIS